VTCRAPGVGAAGIPAVHSRPNIHHIFQTMDSGFHWKLLLRFQYFRHPWRSRRNDGNVSGFFKGSAI
jgi:hypothetical protein